MQLTREETLKVARLARLRLSDEEVASMSQQMERILSYVEQLQQVETACIPPLAHAADLQNVFAEDICQPSLDRESALGNAPSRDDECFRVPAVL